MNLRILIAMATIIAVTGCSTVQEGLIGDTSANIEPFAKETINALVVEDIDFRDSELIYIRDLVDEEAPEILHLQYLLTEVAEFRRQLILYSLELVRVTDMNSSDEARIAALADAISGQLRSDFITLIDHTGAEFDAMIANIRAQEEFLDAVKAVEPIIKIAADFHSVTLDEILDDALPAVRDLIDGQIRNEFGVFLEHLSYMADRKDQLLIGLRLVRESRTGNVDALQELRRANIIMASSALPPANAAESDLDRAESYLISELKKVGEIESLLDQDRKDYLATRAELERESDEISAGVRSSRMRVNAWLQAHEALANGVKNPGKWLSAALGIAGSVNNTL